MIMLASSLGGYDIVSRATLNCSSKVGVELSEVQGQINAMSGVEGNVLNKSGK